MSVTAASTETETMSTIQFGGLSSGLDTESIISSLMAVESLPLTRLKTTATALTDRKTAYGTLGTALSDLQSKIQAFTLANAGSARTATSSDPTRFTATAGGSAIPGQYRVSVDRLATATRATSTAAIGTAVTDATATGSMSSLALPGTVTAGHVGLAVDGQIVTVTVGDPATTSLRTVIDAIASAIETRIQATDPSATVSASIVDDRLQLAVAGATGNHDVLFGVGGDTSNALAILGVAGQHAGTFGLGTATISGTARLGVTRTSAKLDAAGLTGLASTTGGVLTINGVAIAYDTTVDSLNAVLTRINNSQAGVVASVDRANDRVVLTRRTSGAAAIAIEDTSGSLGAALNLAPGTTTGQVIGQGGQVTVDGRVVTSDTNTITTAIDGVTLNLLDLSTGPATLTIGVDDDAVRKALTNLVTSYNSLADTLDKLTANTSGTAGGALRADPAVTGLAASLRSLLTAVSPGLSGPLTSLGDLGLNSGAIGSKAGTTTRLNVDLDKLSAALATNPTRVAYLLSSGGGIMGPLLARVKALTGSGGLIEGAKSSVDAELRTNSRMQTEVQDRIDLRKAALEAKFATLEATLSKLQSQSSQVSAQAASFNSGN
jgi:flagellar hook-associated protein 2